MSNYEKNHRVLYQKETWETIESNLHISEAHNNGIIHLESHHKFVTGLRLEQTSIPLSRWQLLLTYCYPPMRKPMLNHVLNLECHAGQTCPGVPMLYASLVLQWGKTMEVRGESSVPCSTPDPRRTELGHQQSLTCRLPFPVCSWRVGSTWEASPLTYQPPQKHFQGDGASCPTYH